MAVPRIYQVQFETGFCARDDKYKQDQAVYFAVKEILRARVGISLKSIVEINTLYDRQKPRTDLEQWIEADLAAEKAAAESRQAVSDEGG